MATSPLSKVVQNLCRALVLGDGHERTDGQLLHHFIEHRDEAAFADLVRRHGPMVWGVCRRVLGKHHDAEDAFQATFLVLVRKATTVLPRELVGNWLHGVAYRTALKARTTAARAKARERKATAMSDRKVAGPDAWRDVQPLLDQELQRLPEKYRAAIVLCDLEGKTRKAAARQLHVPEGTLASRLLRGRALLARRLVRHGVSASGGILVAALASEAAAMCVPAPLLASTIHVAAVVASGQPLAAAAASAKVVALTEGVLKSMLLTKLKITTAVLVLVTIVCSGAAVRLRTASAADQSGPAQAAQQATPRATEKEPGVPKGEGPPRSADRAEDPTIELELQREKDTEYRKRAWSLLFTAAGTIEQRGNVERIEDDLVLVCLGSAQTVKVGEILEVYRLGKEPTYCGQVRVVFVKDGDAVTRMVKRSPAKIQVKDFVAARVLEPRQGKATGSGAGADKASAGRLVSKVYPVADLIGRGDADGSESLIRVITKMVDPPGWDVNGGPAAIEYFAQSKSLVVSQTADGHERIEVLLKALREARKAQEGK